MPLQDLLIDDVSRLDEEALTRALQGVAAISRDGQLRPGSRWDALGEEQKVVAGLLVVRAAAALKARTSESTKPAELSAMTGVALGTVYRMVRELTRARVATQSGRGEYTVTAIQIPRAIERLEHKRTANGHRGH